MKEGDIVIDIGFGDYPLRMKLMKVTETEILAKESNGFLVVRYTPEEFKYLKVVA